jgi:APA family basic amino acid/polyamine antiporter
MCTALVVGNTLGMSIFLLPAILAPYGLNALTAWLVTAGGCLCVAWVFAGMARSFPGDDGPYAYACRAFGNQVAFVTLWCYWIAVWIGNAALAIAVVGYLAVFFPLLNGHRWLAAVTAVSLLWGFVLINLRGVRTAGWVQVITTALKLVPQAGIIALGAWVLLARHATQAVHLPATPASLAAVLGASSIALFAMLGIECAAVPAGKVRDPGRTIPRATFAGTLIVALIYLCISGVPMLLIPQAQLAASSAPFADLFARFLGDGYGKLLAAFVIVSGLGTLNGWTLVAGEITQSCARHGGFPAALGKVNSRGAPARAFILTGIIASAMVLMNYDESMAGAFTLLIVISTAANLPMYLACSLAVLVLWRRGQIPHPGPREARWFAAALLATLYCVWIFIGVGAKPLLWALALSGAGVPVYWWYARMQRVTLTA